MAAPEPSDAALELYEALEAFAEGDEDRDYPLLRLCTALTSGDLASIHEWVTDGDEDEPGWQILLDPDRCPADVLPWLAQFDGATITPDMDTEARRNAVKNPEAFGRGTVAAIEAVVKRRLTGTQTVILTERYTGDAWRLRIETLASETPDQAVIEAEINEQQKPIGIVLFFNERLAWTWGTAKESAEYPTWAAVKAGFATWFDYRTYEP